jgi:hypothetical protein
MLLKSHFCPFEWKSITVRYVGTLPIKPLWDWCPASVPLAYHTSGEIAEHEIQNTKIVILNIHENTSFKSFTFFKSNSVVRFQKGFTAKAYHAII